MGNSLRCCLACVLPCGALDLIRIVHLNGFVEEITRQTTAGEILKAYPNHVLSKPCSQGVVRKIMILSPDSELKRGSIYFLIPDSSLPSKKPSNNSTTKNTIKVQKLNLDHHDDNHDETIISKSSKTTSVIVDHDDKKDSDNNKVLSIDLTALDNQENNVLSNVLVCETKSKSKLLKSGKHQRRRSSRGKSGIWQPHLEIITEDL